MNTKKRLFASGLLIALAAAGVLISGSQNVAKAGPGAAPVSIMSPLPLPITGTATVSGTVGAAQSGAWNVGLTGTPAVTAAQSGSWNVGITGNPGVTVANANSQPVPTFTAGASLVTHLGELPRNHFILKNEGQGCPSWAQIKLDGSVQSFSVPAAFNLVITDADWFIGGGIPGSVNSLSLVVGGNPVLQTGALADSSGQAAGNENLTSGIVLSVLPTCSTPGTFQSVVLRGYVVPAS